jgi:selenocysteine-specific elongation factor
MTVVVGTAGHIDHGKTTLLRALTGIDADRLPDERRRGMTLDVGYAHMTLPDGDELDFVDVPGHDRLVGNMLVGAGEIDAVLLVVAADDGPRAQTDEHIALLDALALGHGVVAITKVDAVAHERVEEVRDAVRARLAGTGLSAAPVVGVSSLTGEGLDALRAELVGLRDRVADAVAERPDTGARLGIDRVFTVKGRGVVVTGTLRGGPVERGATLRAVPGAGEFRVREVQVHGRPVERVSGGGRTALNLVALAGSDQAQLARGVVLTTDPSLRATDRLLVQVAAPLRDRARLRLHLGTDAVEATVGRAGRDAIELPGGAAAGVLRLERAVAARAGDRFVLRLATPATVVGGVVLDPEPARGVSRRRQNPERVGSLARAVFGGGDEAVARARTELHGVLGADVASDVRNAFERTVVEALARHHATSPAEIGPALAEIRSMGARTLRRAATLSVEDVTRVSTLMVDGLVTTGIIARDGDRLRLPGHRPDPAPGDLAGAMDRLERALTGVTPQSLTSAAAEAGCPPAGVRALERAGRIVVLAPDLAYAMSTYRDLAATALRLAARAPLAPAAFRDATGTSRKYVMPILEDLDRRGILRRTPDGHVPGPRAPRSATTARA